MTTEVAKQEPRKSLLTLMASEYQMEPATFLEVIKKTVFPALDKNKQPIVVTNEQVAAFLAVAHQYKLNPFTREIFAFPAKGGGITPIVSIDGWIKLANSHESYDGMEIEETESDKGTVTKVKVTIHRKDQRFPVPFTARLSEYHRETEPWMKYPSVMLTHKAIKGAARYAFGFAGLYDEDEGQDMINVTSESEILERSTATQTKKLKEKIADKKSAIPATASESSKPNGEDKAGEEAPPMPSEPPPQSQEPVRTKPAGDIAKRDPESKWTQDERKTFVAALQANNISFEQAKAQLAMFGVSSTAEAKYKHLEPLMTWAERREAATP